MATSCVNGQVVILGLVKIQPPCVGNWLDLKTGYDPSEVSFIKKSIHDLNGILNDVEQNKNSRKRHSRPVGGVRTSTSPSNKKVKLSKEDVRLANKWGIPLEQYAAEKLKVERAEGEYTSVYGK